MICRQYLALASPREGDRRGLAAVAELRTGVARPEDGSLLFLVYWNRPLDKLFEFQMRGLSALQDRGLQIRS